MNNLIERRKHKRYFLSKKDRPKVNFFFDGNSKVAITIINISKGGLLGYTSSIESFLGIEDQHIQLIEIVFPNKDPHQCSGRILRLQPSINENKCFCAVEFSNGDTTDDIDILNTDTSNKSEDVHLSNDELIKRVQELKSYNNIEDTDEEIEIRKQAYDAFDDITKHLSIEEKWFFYEMLDEMKRQEPDYSEVLKEDFLRLCRIGFHQSSNDIKNISHIMFSCKHIEE